MSLSSKYLGYQLFLRAFRICSPDFLPAEINHIKASLGKCAYPDYILSKALYKARRTYFKPDNNEKRQFDFKNTVIVPYTPHLEQLRPTLKSVNSNVIFKYNEKLANKLCKNRLGTPPDNKGVYVINCAKCDKSYIGETGRDLKTRISEHKGDIKKNAKGSGIAKHVHDTGHNFDFNNAQVIFPCTNVHKRHIVEASLIDYFGCYACNLNNGFVELDKSIRHYVRKSIRFKNFRL